MLVRDSVEYIVQRFIIVPMPPGDEDVAIGESLHRRGTVHHAVIGVVGQRYRPRYHSAAVVADGVVGIVHRVQDTDMTREAVGPGNDSISTDGLDRDGRAIVRHWRKGPPPFVVWIIVP